MYLFPNKHFSERAQDKIKSWGSNFKTKQMLTEKSVKKISDSVESQERFTIKGLFSHVDAQLFDFNIRNSAAAPSSECEKVVALNLMFNCAGISKGSLLLAWVDCAAGYRDAAF